VGIVCGKVRFQDSVGCQIDCCHVGVRHVGNEPAQDLELIEACLEAKETCTRNEGQSTTSLVFVSTCFNFQGTKIKDDEILNIYPNICMLTKLFNLLYRRLLAEK
jgi:hypothetical protein